MIIRASRAYHRRADEARRALRKAVKVGAIRPECFCERCGSPKKVQAHHHDYTRPYDVQWLCAKCHGGMEKRQVTAIIDIAQWPYRHIKSVVATGHEELDMWA